MELAGILFLVLLAAPDPESVEDAARSVYQDQRYQSELPGAEPTTQSDASAHDDNESERSRRRSQPMIRRSEGKVIGQAIIWIFATVLGSLAVLWLYATWKERRRVASARPRATVIVQETRAASTPTPDAERLAAEGQYAEALHAILLSALARHANRIAPAWTARHAARALGNDSLTHLVTMVEITMFGGREAGRAEYERACTLFEQSTEAGANPRMT